jgi:predicted DNA-binding antitoxin AbrB/MazE fold protein
MPPLEPVALKKWIIAKRDAQKKLGRELRKMSIELGKGKTTIAEYLENTGYAEQDLATDDELMNKYGVN